MTWEFRVGDTLVQARLRRIGRTHLNPKFDIRTMNLRPFAKQEWNDWHEPRRVKKFG